MCLDCHCSCFKGLLLKITVILPHFLDRALHHFFFFVPCIFYAFNHLISKTNSNAFLGALDLAWKGLQEPCSLCIFPCFWIPYHPLSASQSASCSKKPTSADLRTLMSPVWLPLPLGVLKQGCLWVSLSSCTATFTSTNTTSLCNHSLPWEMTEGDKKKKRRKGRNQDGRHDLGDPGDTGWNILVGW